MAFGDRELIDWKLQNDGKITISMKIGSKQLTGLIYERALHMFEYVISVDGKPIDNRAFSSLNPALRAGNLALNQTIVAIQNVGGNGEMLDLALHRPTRENFTQFSTNEYRLIAKYREHVFVAYIKRESARSWRWSVTNASADGGEGIDAGWERWQQNAIDEVIASLDHTVASVGCC